ncbi:MAG: HlyD family efflux transporter periplasmic adaptor subunit [Legionella sp.]
MRKLLVMGFMVLSLLACSKESKKFNGYIDADLVYLSADFAGRLVDLAVQRGQMVQANQFLFRLEQTSERYDVQLSKGTNQELNAQRQQILAQIQYNEINYRRTLGMRQKRAASQNDLDLAKRDLDVSKQQLSDIDVKIHNNKIDKADKKWKVLRKENFAQELGILFDTYYTQGEYVQAGYPVVALVTKNHIKAVFFVAEPDLQRIKLNQNITIMTQAGAAFASGTINYISNIAEYTPPIIYSQEQSSRLVFRVEAKIESPDLEKIHLGQPVLLELAS